MKAISGLMGLCVGDALGVPVEFKSRDYLLQNPIDKMTGYGTHNQPPGTWSDDSSLTFCLAEAMCGGFNLKAISHNFCRWFNEGYWTAYNEVFDIGGATSKAIFNIQEGISPTKCGGTQELDNGNGSLMRILPLAFYHKSVNFEELINRVHQVSQITHGHLRSQIACGIYISVAVGLLEGLNLKNAYLKGLEKVNFIYNQPPFEKEFNQHFQKIFSGKIDKLSAKDIHSSGYVIHTLEACLWCLLTSSSYKEAVLKAVNLGEDTDTTAAVTGGLAGIYYGYDGIPAEWVSQIAKKEEIMDLAKRLEATVGPV
ncbi:MAG TPA: ADP-ribosylglycohydrolase family protein [Halomicronema sp.]